MQMLESAVSQDWGKAMLKDVIKHARTKKGLIQEEVARQLKITKQTYLMWENGKTEPKASQINQLAKVLGITPNEICRGKLNERIPLNEFMHKLIESNADKELRTLATWEMLDDHKAYIEKLQSQKKTPTNSA